MSKKLDELNERKARLIGLIEAYETAELVTEDTELYPLDPQYGESITGLAKKRRLQESANTCRNSLKEVEAEISAEEYRIDRILSLSMEQKVDLLVRKLILDID